MRQVAIASLLLATSCSKASEVKCGAGTMLKDGVCVVEQKPSAEIPSAQLGSGTANATANTDKAPVPSNTVDC